MLAPGTMPNPPTRPAAKSESPGASPVARSPGEPERARRSGVERSESDSRPAAGPGPRHARRHSRLDEPHEELPHSRPARYRPERPAGRSRLHGSGRHRSLQARGIPGPVAGHGGGTLKSGQTETPSDRKS